MSDEAIVEAVSRWLANDLANIAYNRKWPTEGPNDDLMIAKALTDNVLAALRSEGWEVYRPDDCMETSECAHCVTASIPLEHRFEDFYLVPVPAESEEGNG